jgi:hypothetical protein
MRLWAQELVKKKKGDYLIKKKKKYSNLKYPLTL